MLAGVRKQQLEGVVAKRKDSLYESGKRTGFWIKYRVNHSQEFVIGGFPVCMASIPSSSSITTARIWFTSPESATDLCQRHGDRYSRKFAIYNRR